MVIAHGSPRSQVRRTLADMLADGRLEPGARLPTVAQFAERFAVARGTVLAALAQLESEGLIDNRGHRGRFAPARAVRAPSRTALLLADNELPVDVPIDPGWDLWLDRGIGAALQRRGLLQLKAHADALDAPAMARLHADPPLGVLARIDVAASPDGRRVLDDFIARRVPVVVNHSDERWAATADRVISDFALGTRMLVEHLVARGRRRILRLWPADLAEPPFWLRAREAGFAAAVRDLGLPCLPAQYYAGLPRDPDTPEHYEQRVRALAGSLVEHFLAPEPPDALMCISDGDATLALSACRLFKREPGTDILVVGYDAYWRTCPERAREATPLDATIDKRHDDAGEAMVAMLLERASGQRREPQLRLIPPRLVLPRG